MTDVKVIISADDKASGPLGTPTPTLSVTPNYPSEPLRVGHGFQLGVCAWRTMNGDFLDSHIRLGRSVEHAWLMQADFERRELHSPALIAVGSEQGVIPPTHGFRAGLVLAHSHPNGISAPSMGDWVNAFGWASRGMGFLTIAFPAVPVEQGGLPFLFVPPSPTPREW